MIKFVNIGKTSLDRDAFERVAKYYSRTVKNKIAIYFEPHKEVYGYHIFYENPKRHIIKISTKKCCFLKRKKLDKEAQKYFYIATLIHELRHAWQIEHMSEEKFMETNQQIENQEIADFYSDIEIEARIFENKEIKKAIEIYDMHVLQKQSKDSLKRKNYESARNEAPTVRRKSSKRSSHRRDGNR